jgi:hypothetical protein
MTREQDRPWQPLSPQEVAQVLRDAAFPWRIAGGYAIEAFVERAFRPHGDIDVLMLRRDRMAVRALLKDWDCWAADPPGTLRRWPADELLSASVDHIWCRRDGRDPWRFQLMLDDADGETWHSRRSAAVRRPIAEMGLRNEVGIPFLAPEIQLFYKAKSPRPKDEQDFSAALPLLSELQRVWLRDAIRTAYGDENAWLERFN